MDAEDHIGDRGMKGLVVLPVLWVALVLAAAVALRHHPARLPARAGPTPGVSNRITGALGGRVRRLARRPPDTMADARLGRTIVVGGPVALVDPRLGLGVAIVIYLLPVFEARRVRRRHERAVTRELPEVIDLIRLSLAAGGAVLLALRGVARRPVGPISEALGMVCIRVDRGHRTTDALESLVAATSDDVKPLVRALAGAEHYGTELMPTLDRLATEARDLRRRRAQTAARRVPIRLLLPLVLCVLPAFVLLTLVPTLAGTLDGLRLG
ncbi:MAG: type II secretion system F family protein [Acidimicrobiales bacterium]